MNEEKLARLEDIAKANDSLGDGPNFADINWLLTELREAWAVIDRNCKETKRQYDFDKYENDLLRNERTKMREELAEKTEALTEIYNNHLYGNFVQKKADKVLSKWDRTTKE